MLRQLWLPPILGAVGLACVAVMALSAPAPTPEEKDPRSAGEIRRAQDDLGALRALASDPKADPDELWKLWQEFRLRHMGTPEWRLAAAAMANTPSPLDRLALDQIPTGGQQGMPKAVVAVLGGNPGMNGDVVHLVAVSDDGRLIISDSDKLSLWDANDLQVRATLKPCWCLALSPDGKTLLTCPSDEESPPIRIWDLSGNQPKEKAVIHIPELSSPRMALAADHKTLFTLGWKYHSPPEFIRAWDISAEKPKALPSLPFDKEAYKRNSADYFLVCASRSMVLVDLGGPNKAPMRVWDLDKDPPQVRCCLAADPQLEPGPLAISPDGKTLAMRHIRDEAIVLWDVSGAEAKGLERLESSRFRALTFLPSGNVLASATKDGWLVLRPLNADGRKELGLKEDQNTAAFSLGFEPTTLVFTDDGKTAVLGGRDHIVHVWDIDKGKERFPPSGHRGGIRALAFSPDGKTLASGGAEGGVRLWDLTGAAAKEVAVLTGHTNAVGGLAFFPDGKTLASSGQRAGPDPDRTVRLWDLSGKEPHQKASWEPHRFGTHSIALSPAGSLLVTAGTDGTAPRGESWHGCLRLWDVSTAPPVERAALEFQDSDADGKLLAIQAADRAAFDARGKTLGVLTGQRTLRLYDVTDDGLKAGPQLRPFSRDLGVNTWAFSPDGATLTTLGNGPPEKLPEDTSILSLWRRDGGAIKPWPDFTPVPWQGDRELVFSPDGRRVAGVTLDGDLLVYEIPSGEVAYQWKDAGAARVAFAPDGRHLAVGGGNGVIYILRLPETPAKDAP